MASCSLGGITDLKLFKFCSGSQKIRYDARLMPCKMKCCHLETSFKSSRVQIIYGHVAAVTPPSRIINSLVVNCLPSEKENDGDNLDEKPLCNDTIVPASFKVQPLLTTICDTTSIAEFDLKVGGFRVYVKRDLVERSTPAPSPSLPPAQTSSSNETPGTNGSAVASSFAISKVKSTSSGIQSILETASDEGLVILQSPKVGFFRKSRTIKGKKAPPSCKEKQQVKEGQVLCYVEQLGGEIPIESDISGEIIKILRTDGEPVGYGDALIAILPSFPGIKKLQ